MFVVGVFVFVTFISPIVHEKCRKPFCATFAYVTFLIYFWGKGRKEEQCVWVKKCFVFFLSLKSMF